MDRQEGRMAQVTNVSPPQDDRFDCSQSSHYRIVRTVKEVACVVDWAIDNIDKNESKCPGASYEEGMLAMFEWLVGFNDFPPSTVPGFPMSN